jgi:hypothetical protein
VGSWVFNFNFNGDRKMKELSKKEFLKKLDTFTWGNCVRKAKIKADKEKHLPKMTIHEAFIVPVNK